MKRELYLELEEMLPEAKQVIFSRSVGARVSELAGLQEAISFHASLACALKASIRMLYVFV